MWARWTIKARRVGVDLQNVRMRNVMAISSMICPTEYVRNFSVYEVFLIVEKRENRLTRIFGEWKLGKLHGQVTEFR